MVGSEEMGVVEDCELLLEVKASICGKIPEFYSRAGDPRQFIEKGHFIVQNSWQL